MVTLVNIANTRIYAPEPEFANLDAARFIYFADERTSRNGRPLATKSKITLASTYNKTDGFLGSYIFISEGRRDWALLNSKLIIYARDNPDFRCGWMPSGTEPSIALMCDKKTGVVTNKSKVIPFKSGHFVKINPGCALVVSTDAVGIAASANPSVQFLTPKIPSGDIEPITLQRLSDDGDFSLRFPITQADAPDGTGCAQFEAMVGPKVFAALNIDLRLHRKASNLPDDPGKFKVAPVEYPLFDIEAVGADVPISGTLDPFDDGTFHADRNYLRLRSRGKSANSLPTHLFTSRGHRVHLQASDQAKLVLSYSPLRGELIGGKPVFKQGMYSFTPSGAFEIVTPTAVTSKRQDLVVGAFGTEYLGFVARNGASPGDELRFDPHQPSFDMTSLHGASPPTGWDPEKNHPLGDASTTAWARINPQVRSADVATLYVNQPEAAPAFSISELNGEAGRTRLEFDENGAAVNALCPILPLAGRLRAGAALDAAARMETKIVAVERRLQLRSTSSFRTSRRVGSLGGEQWVTTPQGFLARTRGGGGWDALKIAIGGSKTELLIERRKDAGPGPWALQDFLQREDVFAVITDLKCKELEIGAASLTVEVADWEFQLNLPVPDLDTPPAAVTAAGLSLIIKFRKGALTNLVEKEGEWAGARFLNNDDPVAARVRVLGQITEIRKRSADTKPGIPDLYAPIIKNRIDDKEWMGVIVFDALAPPDGFPNAVKALAGGLDRDAQGQPKPLQVPAIGVDRNRIAKGGSGAEIAESTVFAIIDYDRPPKEQEKEISSDVGRSWSGFRVEQLKLLIQNSAVDSFYAKMKLRVGKLFGGDLAYDSAAGAAAGVYEIHGTYERRVVNGESKDVYTFVGTEPRTWAFRRGAPLLTQIDVKRVKLTSDVTNDTITGRFAISGALSFNKEKFSALGVSLEKVEFADAAVEMVFARSGGSPKFGISVGACRVELGADAGLGKLFKDMPFKLSGLLVGGDKGFKLPDLSFLQFDGGDTQLAFGLDFTLDAGFFGRMVSAAKSLNLRIALAWPSFEQISGGNWLPALGVRFDGGSGPLEIGLQGVLRFSAKMMKTIEVEHDGKRLFLIELLQCTFEALGRKFPQPGNGDLCLYIYAPAGQGGAVGWFGDIRDITSGSFELPYFGAGQRVYPPGGDSSFRSTKDFVEYIAQQNKATKTRGKANKLPAVRTSQSNLDFMKKLSYDPRAGWLVAGQAKIPNVVSAYLAFADMPDGDLYGLRVEIPNGGSTFMVDAMYRRLADDLGVFSIEFSVPEAFRTWDVGAATVVIGNLGLEVYTNGDWRFDLGFPRGQDYTRSFQVQLLPFIGWGGAYIAQKSARTSTMLPGCDPVVELGFALRVGLGKEIRRGPFAAGASISVYGVFEGAVGKCPVNGKGKRVTYIRVIGRAGIIAEIFGAIDFGIVRAAVGLCAWAEMGVDLETGKDIILFIEAGVSVYVVVVIARIRIWRSEIEITVSFSYSTQISYQWTIPAKVPGGLLPAGYSGERIKWDSTLVIEPDRPRLPLTFAFDAAISAEGSGPVNRVSLVPMTTLMGQDGGIAAGRLALALFRWALKSDNRSLTSLTPEEFKAFADKIEQPDSLSRGSDKPLDYDAISKFLKLNFVAEISAPPPPEEDGKTRTQSGIFVPMPPDLELVTKKGKVWTAADARTLSQKQEEELRKFFDRMALFFRDRQVTKSFANEVPKPSVTMVFEDWIALILKSTVQSARKIFDVVEADARGTQIPLDSVFEKILAESGPAFSMASRFLLHGLRVPLLTAKGSVKDDEPFFDFLRLQIDADLAVIKDAVDPNDKEKRVDIELTVPGAASWIKVDAARPIAQISLKDIADLETILTQAPFDPPAVSYEQAPSARIVPVTHPMISAITLKGADNRTLRRFPADLLLALQNGKVPVKAQLNAIVETGDGMRRQRQVKPLDRRDWAWAATFEVSVRPVAGVEKVYELIGANGASRMRLEMLLSSKWRDNMKIHLLRPDGSELNHDAVAAGEVLLVKTNLSVENSPPKTFKIFADDETFTADMIADAGLFARLVEQCSIVNSGGFWLRYPHAEQWFSDAFTLDKVAKLLIVIEFSFDTLPGTGESVVVPMFVDSMLTPSKDFPIVEIERTDAAGKVAIANVQPGCIVIEAKRKNPNHKSTAAAATTYADKVKIELSARYNLLDYEFANKPKEFNDIEVAQVLPFGPLELDQTRGGGGGARGARSEPPEHWRYKIVVPLYRLAVDNGKAIKQSEASPYAAIGTDKIRIALGARDIFGNRLPTTLAPSGVRSLQAKLDGRPISYLYFDRIPPVGEWPGVTIRYIPKGVKKSNRLQVFLAFDKKTITAIKARIKKPHAKADEINQFSAFYHNLRHLLGGPAISANIQASCGVSAQQDVLEVLKDIVKRICDEVDGAPVSFALPLGELNLSAFAAAMPSVHKLEISFTIKRTDFIDPAAAHDSSVSCMSYVVPPGEFAVLKGRRTGIRSVTSSSWADFAQRFEEAVPGVKFLRPVDQRGDGAAWLAKADFVAIESDFTNVHAYAMSPLSTSLTSAPVNMSVIESKDLQSRRVVDADMDVLAGKAIKLLEAALNPAIAMGVRAVASDADDPDGSNSLHKILAAKKLIAKAYSDRLTTIKGATPAKALVEEAMGLAYKRMCADLRNAYDIGAVVQVLGKTYPETAENSRFIYGEPKLLKESVNAESLSLDVARYQRRAKGPVALTFAVTYKSGIAETKPVYDFNETIRFEPGLIEVSEGNPEQATAADSYIPSEWLQILYAVPKATFTIATKLPLRRFPAMPKILGHAATGDDPLTSGTLKDHVEAARSWNYRFDWNHGGSSPADTYDLRVTYPKSQAFRMQGAAERDELLACLIGLDEARVRIEGALIKPESNQAEIKFLASQLVRLGKALRAYGLSEKTAVAMDAPRESDHLQLNLESTPPRLTLEEDQIARRADWIGYIGKPGKSPLSAPGKRSSKTSVRDDEGFGLGNYGLGAKSLDVMSEPAAWGSIGVIRNQLLNEAFVYRTPVIRVAEALPARRIYNGWISLKSAASETLQDSLKRFMQLLVHEKNGGYKLQVFSSLAIPLTTQATAKRGSLGAWASHPIPSIPPRPINTPGDIDTFIADLVGGIGQWNAELPVPVDTGIGSPELRFSFTVFAKIVLDVGGNGVAVETPVLSMPNTYIGVTAAMWKRTSRARKKAA